MKAEGVGLRSFARDWDRDNETGDVDEVTVGGFGFLWKDAMGVSGTWRRSFYTFFLEMAGQFDALNSGHSTEESSGDYSGVNIACGVATTFREAGDFPESNFTDQHSNIFGLRNFSLFRHTLKCRISWCACACWSTVLVKSDMEALPHLEIMSSETFDSAFNHRCEIPSYGISLLGP